jgi:signal transduction histidine kinase
MRVKAVTGFLAGGWDMSSENASFPDDMPDSTKKDVPEECASFEGLLSTIAGDLGEVRPDRFDEVLTTCLRKLVEFIGFDRSTIMMFSEDKKQLTVTHCWAREGVPRAAEGTVLDDDLWYVHQIQSGHMVRISSAADWPAEASGDLKYVSEYRIKSTISIPLMIGGTVVGVLTFATVHKERSWSREMVSRLRLIGEIIALGARRRRDTEELRVLARSMDQKLASQNQRMRRLAFGLIDAEHKERVRISELLHEDVMQIIALAGMYIDSSPKEDANSRAAAVLHSKELIQAVLKKLRNLAKELRCDILWKGGLINGLHWQVGQIQQAANLSVDVHVNDDIKCASKDVQLFIYRSVSELLENVAAHSHTNRARLEIRHDDSRIQIAVSDDGIGFELDSIECIPSKSFGLFSIREQAELLGGELEIATSSGHGTRVILTVPDAVEVSNLPT